MLILVGAAHLGLTRFNPKYMYIPICLDPSPRFEPDPTIFFCYTFVLRTQPNTLGGGAPVPLRLLTMYSPAKHCLGAGSMTKRLAAQSIYLYLCIYIHTYMLSPVLEI